MKEIIKKRLRNMSLGERMKCELAASFLHSPKVIFLDEPTIGLDIVSSKSIRNFLKAKNEKDGTTIILTSHYMGDIDYLCKRVVIINKGQKVYDGDLSLLKTKYAPEKQIEISSEQEIDIEAFSGIPGKITFSENKVIVRVTKDKIGEVANDIFNKFDPENITISDIDTEEVIAKIFQENK